MPTRPQRIQHQDQRPRCAWVSEDPLYVAYHDREWGVPEHDDDALFAKLVLDGFQAGLSWITILRKREHFLRAFDGFDAERMARYRPAKVESLLKDAGIIRNRQKVESAVKNARAYLALREKESFDAFLWGFTGGKTKMNAWRSRQHLPAETAESKAMSKELVKRGFSFVGPTICYAFMQAVGIVNDHTTDCFRYGAVAAPHRAGKAPRSR